MSSYQLDKIYYGGFLALCCLSLLCIHCNAVEDNPNTIYVNVNTTTNTFSNRYNINNGMTKILIQNVAQNDGFFLIQVHSFAQKVTLTNGTSFTLKGSVHGTNVGLVKILLPTDATKTFPFYLKAIQSGMVLIAVHVYTSADPIPGGCSMTFNTDIAPYLNLTYAKGLIEADYQDSSIFNHFCEENIVRLEMYRMYLKPSNDLSADAYFDSIESTFSLENVRKNAENITDSGGRISGLRKYISGYEGVGQIFVTVAVFGNRSAAYVPGVTYSCDIACGSESCYDYGWVTWWGFLASVTLVFGIAMFFAEDWAILETVTSLSLGIATYVFYNVLIYSTNAITTALVVSVFLGCLILLCNLQRIHENCPDFIISLLIALYIGCLTVSSGLFDSCSPSVYWISFVCSSALTLILIFGVSFYNPFGYNMMAVVLITMSLSYFCGGTIHHLITDIIRYLMVKNYDIAVKINVLYYDTFYILPIGVFIALLRSICVKTEGRQVVIRIIRVRIQRADYMSISGH